MYIDYSKPIDQRMESIPADRFEVSRNHSKVNLTALVGGAIILAISALIMATSAYGTASFWIGSGEMAVGAACIILGLLSRYYHPNDSSHYHQSLILHRETSLEGYQTLLETDKWVTYSVKMPNYVNLDSIKDKESLERQTNRDISGSIYSLNGAVINPKEHRTDFGDAYFYANQSCIPDMMYPLMSRYQNEGLNIRVLQRAVPDLKARNTKFNLICKGSKKYLEISQLFQISQLTETANKVCLKYIKVTMHIDFQTGDAIVCWKSPQDDLPEL